MMKRQALAFLALLAVGAADTTPVEKVVGLLTDLKGKLEADGKHESQVYNKFACWCETTTKRKATDITTAENDLRSLGQQILKLKGKVATLASEIEDINAKLAESAEQQAEATSLRQKRNGKFMALSEETKQTLAALETAIQVLAEGSSLLQTDSAARAMSAVQSVLDKIPMDLPLSSDHVSVLSEFLQNGVDSKYAPQSATIQGILTDMYTEFARNLEAATMTEAKQNKNYEKLIATSQQADIDANNVKSRKEEQKAQAESDLADTTATYDTTTDEMKANIKFFDEARASCEEKHAEYTTRTGLRDEEAAGIEKALELLTSDAARDLFASSIKPGVGTFFLQLSDDAQAVASKAFGMLKAEATKAKSLRLGMLAVQVRTAKAGHFDAVMKAIDDMVKTLNEEGAADRAKKNQCNDEYQKIAQTTADLSWKIENNDAKIDKLEGLIEMRQQEKAETIEQIKASQDFRARITADRKAENDAFKAAQQDDADAIKLLNSAKDALTAFYKKNEVDMGPEEGLRLIQKADPAFAVSEDQAPDASLSGKGNNKGQSKGIVSLMNYIIEDLEGEVVSDKKNEAKSQAAYEEATNTAKELEADLAAKESDLKSIIAKRGSDKEEENKDKTENTNALNAENDYKDKITPDCDWIKKNFDGRATARSAEMNGLVSAKEFLAGKASLLQLQAPVEVKTAGEDKLVNIHFLAMH